jgi:hypothetical protein
MTDKQILEAEKQYELERKAEEYDNCMLILDELYVPRENRDGKVHSLMVRMMMTDRKLPYEDIAREHQNLSVGKVDIKSPRRHLSWHSLSNKAKDIRINRMEMAIAIGLKSHDR